MSIPYHKITAEKEPCFPIHTHILDKYNIIQYITTGCLTIADRRLSHTASRGTANGASSHILPTKTVRWRVGGADTSVSLLSRGRRSARAADSPSPLDASDPWQYDRVSNQNHLRPQHSGWTLMTSHPAGGRRRRMTSRHSDRDVISSQQNVM